MEVFRDKRNLCSLVPDHNIVLQRTPILFLIKGVAISSIVFGILAAMDCYVSRKCMASTSGDLGIWNYIRFSQDSLALQIHGSSRAWVQFDPDPIEHTSGLKSFNFGIDGHTFHLQKLRYELASARFGRPKVLIHEVSYYTLSKRSDLYGMDQFLVNIRDKKVWEYVQQYEGYEWYDHYVPFIRYMKSPSILMEAVNGKSFGRLAEDSAGRYNNGFKCRNQMWNNDFREARQGGFEMALTIDSASYALFEEYLEELHMAGTQVFLVYSPEYIDAQRIALNRDSLIGLYHSLSHKHDVHFIDFSKHPICYDTSFFYNSQHLNCTGTELFNKDLCLIIDSLLIRDW